MLRKSSVILKARAVVSPRDIMLWFNDIDSFFAQRPDIREAIDDPSRVFNQDETAAELGIGSQWVLVP